MRCTLNKRPRLILFVLLLCLPLVGCKPRGKNETAAVLASAAQAELGDTRHQKEDFDHSLVLINSLNDSPSLPNTPGYEKLVSIADRLNKWISNQKPDDSWKPDTPFNEIESAAQNGAETAKQTVRSLALLRGDNVLDDKGQPLIASETLQSEKESMIAGLKQFAAQLQVLASLADLPSMTRFSQLVTNLQDRFAALDKLPNVNAALIRSLAKQLENETSVFTASATMFEAYARQLKTDELFISTSDVEYLKQSAWMRDIAQWACGDKRVLLDQAIQICDWVACNIEMRNRLIPINQQQAIDMSQQYPWQTVLLGFGTVQDRMTVFLELLRQLRIDAAVLAVPHPTEPNIPLYWGIGVLLDGEVYVFMLDYGFPFPGAEGVNVNDDGSLKFSSVATLSQLQQDDSLLRLLDVSETQKFPLTAEMLKKTTAFLFATPENVSMRMKVLEAELSGEQNMVLYTDPNELRRRFLAASGIASVEFWKYPLRTAFEQQFNPDSTNEAMSIFTVLRPRHNLDDSLTSQHYPLWSGRVLYFKGAIEGQENAISKYQNTRVPDKEIIGYRNDPVFRNNPALSTQLQWISVQASFWLGTSLFEIDSMGAAKDCLLNIRTNPLNSWRNSTEYLLGRIAEREKRYEDAKKHYQNTSTSLSGVGNAVRAKWLPGKKE